MSEETKEQKASAQAKSNETITIKKESLWKYSTFILAAILIVVLFMNYSGNNNPSPTARVVDTGNQPTQPTQPTEPSVVRAEIDDDSVLGNANAPVTIIEFSDYQCPFCERFETQTFPQIKAQYIDTGKVKFVYRDFPLTSIHPNAQPAAEATECVKLKGGDTAFWKMHDKIFANQAALSVDNLKTWAKDLGYDIGDCLDKGQARGEVTKDSQDAQAAGGRGTPYFVINGKPLSGAQPFESFKQVIEAELAA